MRPNTKMFAKALEANSRLEKFDLSRELLLPIVHAGASARANATRHHPASFPGISCWAEATRELRDRLVPRGWQIDNTDNIPSVVHKGFNAKLAICNSNSSTGKALEHPQPNREKGDGSKRANFANQPMFVNFFPETTGRMTETGNSFWYLCIYCGDEETRAELLSPVIDSDGLFGDFYERIFIIGENDDEGSLKLSRRNVPETVIDDSPIEINVIRKQGTNW